MQEDRQASRPAKRKRLDPRQREAEIVEAAVLYFSEVGFSGSMRDLAARLGISHALLFRYFPTKEALVDRVYDRIFLSRWNPAWDAMLDDRSLDLSERLVRFYAQYLRAIDNPSWVRTFIYAGLAGVNINQRYLKLIERKVIAPVARELVSQAGRRSASSSEKALELSWGLHGEIFYLAIRRWVYGARVTTDIEGFAALTVTKFLEGAPSALQAGRRTYPTPPAPFG